MYVCACLIVCIFVCVSVRAYDLCVYDFLIIVSICQDMFNQIKQLNYIL